LCHLTDDFTAAYWAGRLGGKDPGLAGFDTEMYQFLAKPYRNFATRKFDDGKNGKTIGDSAADVILNASLLEIDHSAGMVHSLRVASMNDDKRAPKKLTEFTIQADVYVLACGAVGNAHQLLLSNAGNEHDHVGRNFMCHPLTRNHVVHIERDYLNAREWRLMSGEVGLRPIPFQSDDSVAIQARFSPNAEKQKELGIGSCWFWPGSNQYYFEMAPNPQSRVTLADTLDPVFGQQQTHITWKLTDRDKTTWDQTTRLFQIAVETHNPSGSVRFDSWDDVKSQLVVNGHHIGTTRMSANPEDGVVDKNLKMHSLANLYVAGSSVFPSTGISNPTFTIITLSIRLAEHLTGVLGKRPTT